MENLLNEIISNKSIAVALLAWFFSQSIKIVMNLIKQRKIDSRLLLASGGVVSSHCAAVSALAISVGRNFGWNTPLFAISAIFASIVISDASGIRQEAGKQAEILNKIIEDLYQKKGIKTERLRELLGHTATEVFWGVLLGILVGMLF